MATQSRDFTFVGTVCRCFAAAERRVSPRAGQPAFGTNTTLLEPHRSVPLRRSPADGDRGVPAPAGWRRGPFAGGFQCPAGLFPDIAPVPFDEGLRRTVEWFQA